MKQYLLLFLMLISTFVSAQSQRELYNNSIKAYEAKDYVIFLKLTKTLDSIRPFHPTFTYNLASAYALNDKANESLAVLKKLVLMNNTTEFEKDADFNSLQNTEGFKAILELKATQSILIANSKKVATLSEKALHPEGLVYLSKTKIWLASSIHQRKIIAFDKNTGVCTDWLKTDDMLAVFALKADAKEEYLWVATSAMPEMENFSAALEGKAEILKINLKTKQIVKRFTIEGNHVFGDIYVTKNNTVYVSDSAKPMLYKIENDEMKPFVSFENEAFNLQGITMNEKEHKLFVADYLKGIAVVEIKTLSKTWLTLPEGTIGKGIDGLVFYHNKLIAVQNGVTPIRLTQFNLNKAQNGIESFRILDNNRPEFDEPALATIVGNRLYFFANSPWKAYDKNGVLDLNKVKNPDLYYLEF
ncbi:YncE family protein [Flavobacterium sp.]|uniref:YncE family protein n=1 Tax=Flavobacterium sp. TaxID=239 RepID=UPI00391D9655